MPLKETAVKHVRASRSIQALNYLETILISLRTRNRNVHLSPKETGDFRVVNHFVMLVDEPVIRLPSGSAERLGIFISESLPIGVAHGRRSLSLLFQGRLLSHFC